MTRLKVSQRGRVPAFIALEVLRDANARAAQGESIVHLEIGQPGTAAPRGVIEAAKRALDTHQIGYTEALGLPALRQRIARHYHDFYGVEVDPARVVVTTGSSGAFLLGFLAAFDAGDRVALAYPAYPAYRNILLALDLVPVAVPTGPETRYQPTPELLDRAGEIDGLIVASPANPTGTMLGADELRHIHDYCAARGIRLVSDEIYHGITYGDPPATAAAFGEDAIVVNSFSKYFSMTGWRLGWMVVPEAMVPVVERLAQNLYICPSTVAQHAALACFEPGSLAEYERRRAEFRTRRDFLVPALDRLGLTVPVPPDGAFYAWADVSRYSDSSWDFSFELMHEAHLALTPGRDFGHHDTARYLRLSYANSMAQLQETVARLERVLAAR